MLENKCPRCHRGAIISYMIALNRECENCHYVFESEPGTFTGALYLSLSLLGLSTLPFILILAIPGTSVFGVACLAILWLIVVSPFTMRFSKIAWAKMIYKQNQKANR